MPNGQRIAELLLDIGAVKLSLDPPFTWSSGIKSPIYCDNRMVYSHPDARKFVVDALVQRVKSMQVEPDVIAGTATGAIGWAALVAERLGLPFVYVRSQAKGHGAKKRVEGDIPHGKDIVLIEDLFSTGGSAISSVEALREEVDGNVSDVIAIFTYEMLASTEKAQSASVKLHPLASLSILLKVAGDQGRLTKEDISKVAEFSSDPKAWGEKL
ncbi:orotate phosphoribosyltransferase [Candidatus Peregrinibacteria bacterium]|nr:orotate phosphoribosyltransferase [Candidatus Peregrinibacteria bacterium]MBT6731096.1 orotate phosphoribosyltransferase [Candidatus Peregrinibacteria bacterium]MBT7009760.1 orotate phosphoribosyltransferase [Candidatus Peregrinibacteria bacterium]MBT7344812.1 orotate phosphoribosyltransferase [Candidatus Peregrinibacteria bacterium]